MNWAVTRGPDFHVADGERSAADLISTGSFEIVSARIRLLGRELAFFEARNVERHFVTIHVARYGVLRGDVEFIFFRERAGVPPARPISLSTTAPAFRAGRDHFQRFLEGGDEAMRERVHMTEQIDTGLLHFVFRLKLQIAILELHGDIRCY